MKNSDRLKSLSGVVRNEVLAENLKNGEKAIGYFCSYVPEEIIAAAGFIPYKMRGVGSTGTELADTYYSSTNCLYPRHILDLAMKGEYDFLDGIIFSNSCDHTRRLYDIWLEAVPGKPGFIHFLDVPHLMGEVQERRFKDILQELISDIEKYSGRKISDDDLLGSVKEYNRRRKLLRSIYKKRTLPGTEVKGSDFLEIMLAVTAMPVRKGNEMLEQIGCELGNSSSMPDSERIRIVLAGGCMEESSFLRMIEEAGALIVEDNTCLGWRHSDGDIEETGDILMNISRRYLHHLSCPRISNDYDRRLSHISGIMNRGEADAVIFSRLPFCILYSGESYMFKEESRKYGYPLLIIERGYGDKSDGQYKTRVQALIEEIRNRKSLQ